MSMAWYGLPAAVIRMKARRIEREREDWMSERLAELAKRLAAGGRDVELTGRPEWVSELLQ